MATQNELPRFNPEAAFTASAESDRWIVYGGDLPRDTRLVQYDVMAEWSHRLGLPVSKDMERVSGHTSRILTAMCLPQLLENEEEARLLWAEQRSAQLRDTVTQALSGLWVALYPTDEEGLSGTARLAKLVDFQLGPYDPRYGIEERRRRLMGADVVVPNPVLEGSDGQRGLFHDPARLYVEN